MDEKRKGRICMKQYGVERKEAETTVDEFLAHCVDVPKFLEYCKACPNYDTRWSCPSFEFNPMDIWKTYKALRLYAWILTPEEGCTTEALLQGLTEQKTETIKALMAMEAANPGSWALVCGTCNLCNACQRSQGRPCIHPDELRYSIEAMGGDVGETMRRYFQKEIQWIRNGVLPDYLMLVGGLLLP